MEYATVPRGQNRGASSTKEYDDLFEKCKNVRQQFDRDWYLNLCYYAGDQWIMWNRGRIDRPRLERWRVKFVDNRILPVVTTRVAKKLKTRPAWVATPTSIDDDDLSAAELAEKVLVNDWNEFNLDYKHLMVELWTEICGAGFWKVFWDKTEGDSAEFLFGPNGPITNNGQPVKVEDARLNGIYDALASQFGEQLTTKTVGLGDIAVETISPFEIFPDPLATSLDDCEFIFEEKIRSIEYIKKVYGEEVKEDSAAPAGIAESRMGPSYTGTGGEYKGASVKEYFCRPNSKDPDGKWVVFTKDKILREGTIKDSPYDEFPYVMFSAQIVPGRFWPTAITTQLRSPQTDLNKIGSLIRENAIRLGNPSIMTSRQANVAYSGVPGERIYYDDTVQNAAPSFLEPPNVPTYVREEIDRLQNSINEISGIHEVSNASVPAGITAASAINLLQEADDTRLAPEIQAMEKTLSLAGTKIVRLKAKYMSDERFIKIAGEDGAWDIQAYRREVLKKTPNIEVQAGSSMPRSKAAKQAAMTELLALAFQYGVEIDQSSLRKFFRDYELGGLERLFEDIQPDEVQVVREHRTMYTNTAININDWDDDDYHINSHEDEMKTSRFARQDDRIKQLFMLHRQAHIERRLQKMQEQVQQLQQEQQQQQPPPGQGQGQ